MANPEQLKKLKQGVEIWNKWRKRNPNVPIDLLKAKLRDANLSGANLSGADLFDTDLSSANLNYADLSSAHLSGTNFSSANLRVADLRDTDLSSSDLSGADLIGADLSGAYLFDADLSSANLRAANLSRTNLIIVKAFATNFRGATFTGACIEDWHIDSETNLDNVICDYIYLKFNWDYDTKEYKFLKRRPSDPNRNFRPGDFANLFEKSLSTVDLIFFHGIDWQIFLTAFQELQIESKNGELSVQAIEKKRDGAFVIRVDATASANKETIEASFWNKYKSLLEAKDKEIKLLSQKKAFYSQKIEVIRKNNTKLLGIIETMAEKEKIKYNLRGASFNGGFAGKD